MTLVKQKRKTYAQPLVKRAVMLRQVAPVLLSGSISDSMSVNTMGHGVLNYDITPTGGSGGGVAVPACSTGDAGPGLCDDVRDFRRAAGGHPPRRHADLPPLRLETGLQPGCGPGMVGCARAEAADARIQET